MHHQATPQINQIRQQFPNHGIKLGLNCTAALTQHSPVCAFYHHNLRRLISANTYTVMICGILSLQMFAEAVLEPEPFAPALASHLKGKKAAAIGSPGLQWELQHLQQNIASAKQQEELTMYALWTSLCCSKGPYAITQQQAVKQVCSAAGRKQGKQRIN